MLRQMKRVNIFAQAELKRKQAQDEELELLNNIIEDNDKNEAAKTEAVKASC